MCSQPSGDRNCSSSPSTGLPASTNPWVARSSGLTEGDQAPEALLPLFDREVEGFGEVFRMLSFEEIGTSTLQSRAVAGVANKTLIFAMPGSTKACRTAWENIIAPQLDARTRPCNFHPHLKK